MDILYWITIIILSNIWPLFINEAKHLKAKNIDKGCGILIISFILGCIFPPINHMLNVLLFEAIFIVSFIPLGYAFLGFGLTGLVAVIYYSLKYIMYNYWCVFWVTYLICGIFITKEVYTLHKTIT